ncbi:ribbon-helix-helix domain-containing protein [Bradyrhizobium sp. WSM2254]|uniref:ribbon-helix-helix protein, CopG family n=1 Tax=Bradyrhizobium sp. WSM2254 TaxID=1188263 RepID=UPI000485754F
MIDSFSEFLNWGPGHAILTIVGRVQLRDQRASDAKYFIGSYISGGDFLKHQHRLTFRLSRDLADVLIQHAVRKDVSVSAIVREAILTLKFEDRRG